jgi:hypothetical protein
VSLRVELWHAQCRRLCCRRSCVVLDDVAREALLAHNLCENYDSKITVYAYNYLLPLAFLYLRKSALMDELMVIKLYKVSFVVLITGLWSCNVCMGL